MQKIIVIGSERGRVRLISRSVYSEILGIELIHIDRVYWGPDWTEPTIRRMEGYASSNL